MKNQTLAAASADPNLSKAAGFASVQALTPDQPLQYLSMDIKYVRYLEPAMLLLTVMDIYSKGTHPTCSRHIKNAVSCCRYDT